MLDTYKSNGWLLTQVAIDGKNPISNDWTNNGIADVDRWQEWIANGYNIGVLTGEKSGVTVVDLDTSETPQVLLDNMQDTLCQRTNKGLHFFWKYDPELPTTRIDHLKIDILNNGRQCVIHPSVVSGHMREWCDEENEVKPMPKEVKDWLLDNIHKVKNFYETPQLRVQEGQRNDTLIRFGGALRKHLSPSQVCLVLNLVNRNFVSNPLEQRELDAIGKSLNNYHNTDIHSVKHRVLDYMRMVEVASINDLQRATREEPEALAVALYELQTDGHVVPFRKDYKFVHQPRWKTEFSGMGEPVDFKVPFFDDIASFCWGDMVLIGASTGVGKTHIAMNIINQLVKQSLRPYYITTEAGSRFLHIAKELGLKEGDFYWDTIVNIENVKLVDRSITVLDWLMIEDKSMTDRVFQLLQDQMFKTGGFLIVFQQLKDFTNEYFAPNLCKQFPVLATRYIRDEEDYTKAKFKVDKIREIKGKQFVKEVPCIYNWATKEIRQLETESTFYGNKDWTKEEE